MVSGDHRIVTEAQCDLQVLANPSADIQESPAVTKADLKQRGIRPYDEKVRRSTPQTLHLLASTARPVMHGFFRREPGQLSCVHHSLHGHLSE